MTNILLIALLVLAGLLCLGGLTAGLIILVHAFKTSVAGGLLCLFLPFYGLYYMFAKYQSPRKGLIVAIALAGPIVGTMGAGGAISGMNSNAWAEEQARIEAQRQAARATVRKASKPECTCSRGDPLCSCP